MYSLIALTKECPGSQYYTLFSDQCFVVSSHMGMKADLGLIWPQVMHMWSSSLESRLHLALCWALYIFRVSILAVSKSEMAW